MPTVIRAVCQGCGELELEPADIHLHTFDRGGRDYYEFMCPSCGDAISRPAPGEVIRALRIGRVPETKIFLPAEALDPARARMAPLTKDDLLDLVLALDDDEVPAGFFT